MSLSILVRKLYLYLQIRSPKWILSVVLTHPEIKDLKFNSLVYIIQIYKILYREHKEYNVLKQERY